MEYLTPQDVVRESHGLSDQNCSLASTAKTFGENENMMDCITPSQAEKGMTNNSFINQCTLKTKNGN